MNYFHHFYYVGACMDGHTNERACCHERQITKCTGYTQTQVWAGIVLTENIEWTCKIVVI